MIQITARDKVNWIKSIWLNSVSTFTCCSFSHVGDLDVINVPFESSYHTDSWP